MGGFTKAAPSPAKISPACYVNAACSIYGKAPEGEVQAELLGIRGLRMGKHSPIQEFHVVETVWTIDYDSASINPYVQVVIGGVPVFNHRAVRYHCPPGAGAEGDSLIRCGDPVSIHRRRLTVSCPVHANCVKFIYTVSSHAGGVELNGAGTAIFRVIPAVSTAISAGVEVEGADPVTPEIKLHVIQVINARGNFITHHGHSRRTRVSKTCNLCLRGSDVRIGEDDINRDPLSLIALGIRCICVNLYLGFLHTKRYGEAERGVCTWCCRINRAGTGEVKRAGSLVPDPGDPYRIGGRYPDLHRITEVIRRHLGGRGYGHSRCSLINHVEDTAYLL